MYVKTDCNLKDVLIKRYFFSKLKNTVSIFGNYLCGVYVWERTVIWRMYMLRMFFRFQPLLSELFQYLSWLLGSLAIYVFGSQLRLSEVFGFCLVWIVTKLRNSYFPEASFTLHHDYTENVQSVSIEKHATIILVFCEKLPTHFVTT